MTQTRLPAPEEQSDLGMQCSLGFSLEEFKKNIVNTFLLYLVQICICPFYLVHSEVVNWPVLLP